MKLQKVNKEDYPYWVKEFGDNVTYEAGYEKTDTRHIWEFNISFPLKQKTPDHKPDVL